MSMPSSLVQRLPKPQAIRTDGLNSRYKYMMMRLALIFAVLNSAVSAGDTESFERIKSDLASAQCAHLEFISIVESDIFESVDSLTGEACIAQDGRYRVLVGPDTYLFDGSNVYSYSKPNNQVTIEPVNPETYRSDEISFLTRLDDFYTSRPLNGDDRFFLKRKSARAASIPDSLTVIIDSDAVRIVSLEYYDINDELNKISMLNQELSDSCSSGSFLPDFPDSAEVVRLY
jgi:outer membrane lipoprotein-sorting protein